MRRRTVHLVREARGSVHSWQKHIARNDTTGGEAWTALALTFLLRNPVARAVSHSHHMRDEGHEPLPTRESALDSDPPALVVSTTPRIGPTEAYAPGAPRHRTAGSP